MSLRDFADPARWSVTPSDLELFETKVGDFVPPDAFDAHAHWYHLSHIVDEPDADTPVGHDAMQASMRQWMGDRVVTEGLYFGYPTRTVDRKAENRFVADQVRAHPGCAGLMLIGPEDYPDEVERTGVDDGLSGFKVYQLVDDRVETGQ